MRVAGAAAFGLTALAAHAADTPNYRIAFASCADESDVKVLTNDQFEDGTPTWIP